MSAMTRTIAAVMAAALLPSVAGCAASGPAGDIPLAGDTRADLVTVAAPRFDVPALDVTVGIAKLQTPAARGVARKKAQAAAAAAAFNRAPVPAGLLTTVTVRAGDAVKKGQVLATFDEALLRLAVRYAEAGYRRASKTADTLDANASDLRDQRATIRRTGRAGLAAGQKKLEAARAQLLPQLSQMEATIASVRRDRANLAQLEAQMGRLQAELQQLIAANPAPTPDVRRQIAALQSQLAALGKRIGMVAALPRLEAGLAKMKSGLAQLQAGQAQLDSGREKLASGLAKMSDGIDQLGGAADTLRLASGVQSASLQSARATLAAATLRSPCDGVVVSAMPAGQVAMVGAPVVVIRPAGDTLVDVYLAPEQMAGVKVGDPADVTLDSVRGVLKGTVAVVWPEQVFPPSNYPTKVVHMSRVTRVTVRVPDGALPRGVPADVVLHVSP